MNKKLIYSLIAGTMFTLTSCDDFLDVQPASGFTPEYIFSSESEMKALMTRIYSSMTGRWLRRPACGNDGRRIVRK